MLGTVTAIDHVGVRVPDLDAAIGLFVDRLGAELLERGLGPDGVIRVAFVRIGDVDFEIFESADADSAALDHVALHTPGAVGAAAEALEEVGVRPSTGELQGMRGTTAIRLEPETTLGIRFHLSARPMTIGETHGR